MNNLPLIVILGPTASGKTSYAISLASRIQGEIICADSRTVYRGMNVGTAKPTLVEQRGQPHWGLDLVDPSDQFNLYDFQQYALTKIKQIRRRGHIPMLVGGSGLYIDSVIYNYELTTQTSISSPSRDVLNNLSLAELKNYIVKNQLELPSDPANRRRLIRQIERTGTNNKCTQLLDNTVVTGIKTDRSMLYQRIEQRCQTMLAAGLVQETEGLLNKYGSVEPLRHNLYGVMIDYLAGQLTNSQLIDKMVMTDRRLVKKQLTWLSRPKSIQDVYWRGLSELMGELSMVKGESSRTIVNRLVDEYKKFRNDTN